MAVVAAMIVITEIAPISGHLPELKVDARCKARSAGEVDGSSPKHKALRIVCAMKQLPKRS
jgi:hypothetical protein